MKPFLIFVDDDPRYETFLEMVAYNVNELTRKQVEIVTIIGIKLSAAKPLVLNEFFSRKEKGGHLEGIAIDIADQINDEPRGGVELLKEIRKEPGFAKGELRILLVTITGHVQLGEVPEADDIISRMNGATPRDAAERLLLDFGLDSYIKKQ